IEGSKDGLLDDLDLKRREAKPLEIINGPLMAGMDEVGRLFNNNELIVAEVLQSGEAMKAAVAHREPFMEKSESANTGTAALANKLVSEETREAMAAKVQAEQARLRAAPARTVAATPAAAAPLIRHDQPVPTPPDLKRHVLDPFPLEDVFPYVNPAMLYGKHLGLRGNLETLLGQSDEKAARLRERVAGVENEVLANGTMPPRAVFKFFPAQSEGDAILLYGPGHKVVEIFTFPRQATGEGLCLADFVAPRSTGVTDYVALFAVTCGGGVRELAERWKAEGRFLDSHILQALAIEGAEAFAELLHRRLREMWGFPDPPEMTMQERFKA